MLRIASSLLLLAACATPPSPGASEADAALARRCADLVASPPGEWHLHVPAVLAAGRTAATPLIAASSADPDGDGRQAVLGVLGALGDPSAIPYLRAELTSGRGHGGEAALALAALGAHGATDALADVAADAERDVTTRTGAACALLELGEIDAALPLLEAVLLASTPAGREAATRHRLPVRPRWALERQMVITSIARSFGGRTFGLDPDSSWAQLETATRRFVEAARARARGQG